MSIIGVDPGQKGGIALIDRDGKAVEYSIMPDTVVGIVHLLDGYRQISIQLGKLPDMIVERAQAMPSQGVSSSFNYGRHFGTFEAWAAAGDVRYHEVSPAKWKRDMGLNADKANAVRACERLFPGVNLLPTPRCKKPSDGIAEALLIAAWGRRYL